MNSHLNPIPLPSQTYASHRKLNPLTLLASPNNLNLSVPLLAGASRPLNLSLFLLTEPVSHVGSKLILLLNSTALFTLPMTIDTCLDQCLQGKKFFWFFLYFFEKNVDLGLYLQVFAGGG